ncbi:uncharacterized protein FIESC28_00657 [Fusarium coffeatum]|uniref:ferric-chelate reductase (NADPH) n=1 Tax=Fusarium coffeatum TaxID=231269 RepID=A0A366SCT8_9HYPO|nr:uncharacterized protein FIESC28_00657 [Fusarium coffeatum]RBR26540.1 hypothetical protein FIESC28_00657 [Fusarium coffeatum]
MHAQANCIWKALLGICTVLLPTSALARLLPYELVLLSHNTVALSLGYMVWSHVPADQQLVRATLCVLAGIFLVLTLVRAISIAYNNHFWFQSIVLEQNGCSRYVRIIVNLRRPLRVQPGQYVKIWTPTTISSVLQSHPFTIGNCSSENERELRIVVEVKNGFTRNLKDLAERCMTSNIAIFAGPYGSRVPVGNYETVLLVATGLGFVALSPYLQWLVRAAHNSKIRISPVHLVWQVSSWEQFFAVGDLLVQNIELDDNKEEKNDRTYIRTSIFYEEIGTPPHWAKRKIHTIKKMTKNWNRVDFQERPMPLSDILSNETITERGRDGNKKPTLIAGSVSDDIRDDLIQFATKNSGTIDLMFTDYQPKDQSEPMENGSANLATCDGDKHSTNADISPGKQTPQGEADISPGKQTLQGEADLSSYVGRYQRRI